VKSTWEYLKANVGDVSDEFKQKISDTFKGLIPMIESGVLPKEALVRSIKD